jgi:hypothetical protein
MKFKYKGLSDWTISEENALIKLWNDGGTSKQIAEAFNTHDKAVQNKINRLRSAGFDLASRRAKRKTPSKATGGALPTWRISMDSGERISVVAASPVKALALINPSLSNAVASIAKV